MKNYIYMALMMIPAFVILVIMVILSFLIQLFFLPETIIRQLTKYDREQERKKLFPEQFKGDKK